MRNILLCVVLLASIFLPQFAFADKAVDEYAKMIGKKVVTSSNTDVTYTGKHWKEDGDDKYEYIARIHQAPIYNEDGSLVDCSWHGSEDAWVIVDNVFSAQVIGSYITVTYQGKSMSWNPIVMIDSKEYVAKGSPKVTDDQINENYHNNTLEWDYGVCVRRVRVIEGLIQETWTFDKDPKGNVWIRDYAQTQQGFTWEIEPYGYDANGEPIAVNEYKQVAASVMASAVYPVTIDPTEVFVTSASDGYIWADYPDYATTHDIANGEFVYTGYNFLQIGQAKPSTYAIRRAFLYFDTSALPDGGVISAANLSLYGYSDFSTANFNIVVQNGQPTYPHDPIVVGDYDYTKYSGTGSAFSTAGFNASGYNNISLTAAGLTYISTTGTTKLALLSSEDIADSAPTGNEWISVYSYEKGAGYRPTLYVTYVSSGPPDVTSVAASYVSKTSARVNGYLDSDGGEATTVWFNYWEWYDANWSDCIEFSINASYVDSDLTNFPVLITGAQVNESNPNFWTTVDVNGSDILFTDASGTKLNRELVSIDTTNMSMECYVNVSSIDDTIDTPIYMYYGANVSTHNDSNSTSTWNSDYLAVWHMGDLNTSAISDSTVNNNDGTKIGANEPVQATGLISGGIGYSQDFDGANDYIEVADNVALRLLTGGTIESVINPDSAGENNAGRVVDKAGAGLTGWLLQVTATLNRLDMLLVAAHSQGSNNEYSIGTATNNVITFNSTGFVNHYKDGASWGSGATVNTSDMTNTAALRIGQRQGAEDRTFNGRIDEVRISSSVRSADWIESTYYSLMSPEDFCPVTDVFHETATQSKNTGDSFYTNLTGLTANTLYGFRAMGTQAQGTDYGAWLFFDTSVTLEEPTNVTCKPDSNSITLSWVRGSNTSSTYIRYKTGGYPTGTADGNAIPLQSGVDYVHTGLTSGVTYYYKLWGEDAGDYSTTNSTTACTTNAGFATASPVPLPTVDTSGWSETPNGSVLENNPLYALGNLEADEVGVPHDTWWMLLALGGLVCTGLFIYTRSRNLLAALGAMIIFGVIMAQAGLFPIWTMIIFGLTGIGIGWKEIR